VVILKLLTVFFANEIAKLGEQTTIDTCSMECVYQLAMLDTDYNEGHNEYYMLQQGILFSKYFDYGKYRIDSVLTRMDKMKMTNGYYFNLRKTYKPKSFDGIFFNHQTDMAKVLGKVFIDKYYYYEPKIDFGWQLSDSAKSVCGYTCHKATCSFRGRFWTAWYTDEIPVSEGPWKLGGLPGLILAAEDSTKELSFTAISIRNAREPITVDKSHYMKTTRKKLNKAKADYMADPGKVISSSPLAPKDMDGKRITIPKKKLFYVPLEKE